VATKKKREKREEKKGKGTKKKGSYCISPSKTLLARIPTSEKDLVV
jgi:hypothetical protein